MGFAIISKEIHQEQGKEENFEERANGLQMKEKCAQLVYSHPPMANSVFEKKLHKFLGTDREVNEREIMKQKISPEDPTAL